VVGDGKALTQASHVSAVFKGGRYYALPLGSSPSCFTIFQVLSTRPSARKYMQRVCAVADATCLIIPRFGK
jgi:hypothetical protein